jgi:hypothetical protein
MITSFDNIPKNYYYSKSENGFYLKEVHKNKIPEDAILISEDTYKEVMSQQLAGKKIVPGENGQPIAVERDPIIPTWDDIRSERNKLLRESDWVVLADSNPRPTKEAWLTYRQNLRDIPQQYSDPSEIIWPQKPA